MSEKCQFKRGDVGTYILSLVIPLSAIGAALQANSIVEKFNKANLLASFKVDFIKVPGGPEFRLAKKALEPYFSPSEWDELIRDIVQSKMEALDKGEPKVLEPVLKSLDTILRFEGSTLPTPSYKFVANAQLPDQANTAEATEMTTSYELKKALDAVQKRGDVDLSKYRYVSDWLKRR